MTRAVVAIVTLALVLAGCSGFVRKTVPRRSRRQRCRPTGSGIAGRERRRSEIRHRWSDTRADAFDDEFQLVTRSWHRQKSGQYSVRSNHTRYVAVNKTTYAGSSPEGTESNS